MAPERDLPPVVRWEDLGERKSFKDARENPRIVRHRSHTHAFYIFNQEFSGVPPIYVLTGFNTSVNSEAGRPLARALCDIFKRPVIMSDSEANGHTKPPDIRWLLTANFMTRAQIRADILNALGYNNYDIAATSLGAVTAFYMGMLDYQKTIRSLTLLSLPMRKKTNGGAALHKRTGDFFGLIRDFISEGRDTKDSELPEEVIRERELYTRYFESHRSARRGDFTSHTLRLAAQLGRRRFGVDIDISPYHYNNGTAPTLLKSSWDILGAVDPGQMRKLLPHIPLTLVVGSDERITGPTRQEDAVEVRNSEPGSAPARLVILPGANHTWLNDHRLVACMIFSSVEIMTT